MRALVRESTAAGPPARALIAYRRTGADLPFGDLRAAHGVGLEGYYWRFTDPGGAWSIAAICGVARAPDGLWAMVTLAAEPGHFERTAIAPSARVAEHGLGVTAGSLLRATERRLLVDLGPGARLAATLAGVRGWPRRAWGALGPAHAVPGLGQYWSPHVLGGRPAGAAEVGGRRLDLSDGLLYAEKNWGARFAARWWWGQGGFREDAGFAFAGGRLARAGATVAPTAVAVWTPERVITFVPPLARTVAAASGGAWRVAARRPGLRVEIEAGAAGTTPLRLHVPVVAERRTEPRAEHHLLGRARVMVHRGRRLWIREETTGAALEEGRPS